MDDREELNFIINRVKRHDDSRSPAKLKMEQWEKMYRLDAGFGRDLKTAVEAGQEQITLPTPFAVVHLSQRLLSTTPRIDVIPGDPADKDSINYAEQCEKWLTAMWDEINYVQQRNVLADTIWYILVRGRFALEVKWVKDKYPKALQGSMFPIAIRNLDPYCVGVQRGPLMTEFAYYITEISLLEVVREWPDLLDSQGTALAKRIDFARRNNWSNEDEMVCYIDYWERDPVTGKVMNAVIVEDEYAKKLADSGYPDIPIIVGGGDSAPGIGDEFDGLSILHPLDGLWQYQCRLASQVATMVMWDAWPPVTWMNETGQPMDDLDLGPGSMTQIPSGTTIQIHHLEPNYQLAQAFNQQIDNSVQQASYPEIMYGQTGDQVDSGYNASLRSDAAKGRIKNFRESLEMGISHVCRQVLCLVEKKGGKKGVSIGVVNARDNEKYKLNLNKEMIAGNYQAKVHIKPAVPQDDVQLAVMGKQMADGKYISANTFLDRFVGVEVPSDETRRIALEELMQSDEMRPYRLRRAAEEYYKEDALDILFGTPFMPPAPKGMEWTQNDQGKTMLSPVEPQPAPPVQGGPPMGPPTSDMSGIGAPPPGMSGMPPQGPPIQPPATFAGPMGGGFAPQTQGQLQGENLGMAQDMDPLIFDQLMNTPGSPDEQMNMAAGMPPEGPLY